MDLRRVELVIERSRAISRADHFAITEATENAGVENMAPSDGVEKAEVESVVLSNRDGKHGSERRGTR